MAVQAEVAGASGRRRRAERRRRWGLAPCLPSSSSGGGESSGAPRAEDCSGVERRGGRRRRCRAAQPVRSPPSAAVEELLSLPCPLTPSLAMRCSTLPEAGRAVEAPEAGRAAPSSSLLLRRAAAGSGAARSGLLRLPRRRIGRRGPASSFSGSDDRQLPSPDRSLSSLSLAWSSSMGPTCCKLMRNPEPTLATRSKGGCADG
uniref:Uncharacterized protein n=1 Tax=Oryza sativa subsp. japonica TaxID=39947 RepID=Q8LHI0_ORYSJ|nr:hypothetical protein [Oryza sativa Japonica Group]BAD31750.1 hypothetical protein [Oryza sativa Japonica Group]